MKEIKEMLLENFSGLTSQVLLGIREFSGFFDKFSSEMLSRTFILSF